MCKTIPDLVYFNQLYIFKSPMLMRAYFTPGDLFHHCRHPNTHSPDSQIDNISKDTKYRHNETFHLNRLFIQMTLSE